MELLLSNLSLETYREFLTRRLCWSDGTPTHASSATQRQCPRCRTKWSYGRLATGLRLFEEFVLERRATEAARNAGCAKNTALEYFRRFNMGVELVVTTRLREGEIATSPVTLDELRSLERALRTRDEDLRRNACRHLFFRSLSLEERSADLFRSVMQPAILARLEGGDPRLTPGLASVPVPTYLQDAAISYSLSRVHLEQAVPELSDVVEAVELERSAEATWSGFSEHLAVILDSPRN